MQKQLLRTLGYAALLSGTGLAVPSPAQAGTPVPGINRVTGLEISSDNRGTHIVIEGTNPFTPDVKPVGRPSATVIMVPGRWDAGRAGLTSVRRGGVWTVRYGQFADGRSGSVRIVANTRQKLNSTVLPSADHRRWEVTMWAPGVTPVSPRAATPASKVTPKIAAAQPPVTTPAAPVVRGVPFTTAPVAAPVSVPAPVATLAAVKTVPAAATPMPLTLAAPKPFAPDQTVDAGLRRVSLDFVAADINDVLKALSLQSGVNIVTGADVKGNITVTLKQVSLNDALDMVTRLSGFKYAKFGPAYVVGTPASVTSIMGPTAEVTEEPITEFIPYRYNTTANLTRVLGDRFPGLKLPDASKDTGPAASGPKTLVVTDSPKRVSEVRAFVEKMEQAVSVPTVAAATEVYRVRYASPVDLVGILGRLVPSLSVQMGPSPGFVSGSSGASASYAAGGSAGGGSGAASGGGGGGAAGGGGTANPGGATASGSQPNTLLLTGATADIVRAREVLTQIDVRQQQIQFEARVVDVNRDDSRQLGLRYVFNRPVQIGESNFQKDGTTGGVGTPVNDPGTLSRDLNFGSIYRTPYSITATLDALENNNRAKTLANPNLAALDGQPAVVFIGDQIKYVINIQQTQQGQNIQTETATVGITLKVTGKSSPDGTVTLFVHPEVSTVTSYRDLGNGITLPQIGTRFVDTTIRVKDGETIAIGGLIQEADVKNIQKVPLLGDIPFFGQLLFRSTSTRKFRSEIMVFITSRILKD